MVNNNRKHKETTKTEHHKDIIIRENLKQNGTKFKLC